VRQSILLLVFMAGVAGCVPPDRVMIEQASRPAHPAMAMPPKPEGTGRIVVFRPAARGRLLPVAQPSPLLLLNGEPLGEASRETLYIKDVPPGDHEVSIVIRTSNGTADPKIEAETLRATLNDGGEWFLEAGIYYYNCDGVRPIAPAEVTPPIVTAGSLVISFTSIVAAMATTTCQTSLQLRPKWPKFGHEDIYPLLAKQGAGPLQTVESDDRTLPHSGLPWSTVERLVRNHFNDNGALYKPHVDKSGRGNLLLREVSLLSEGREPADTGYIVTVALDYLHVDEQTIAGLHVRRNLRYTLRREDGVLKVADSVNPVAASRAGWVAVAAAADAAALEIEVICSDADEHRRNCGRGNCHARDKIGQQHGDTIENLSRCRPAHRRQRITRQGSVQYSGLFVLKAFYSHCYEIQCAEYDES
jgi:hypothetical protein